MLRQLINRLLYLFGFKKRGKKPAGESLLDLLPIIVAAAVLVGAISQINKELEPRRLSLRQKLARRVKYYLQEEECSLCGGSGEVVERKARQMGYTFGPDEPTDSLEEKLIPCPACKGGE